MTDKKTESQVFVQLTDQTFSMHDSSLQFYYQIKNQVAALSYIFQILIWIPWVAARHKIKLSAM